MVDGFITSGERINDENIQGNNIEILEQIWEDDIDIIKGHVNSLCLIALKHFLNVG